MSTVENNAETTAGGVTGAGFQQGQSGNPGGRPKGIARQLREAAGDDGETYARLVVGGAMTGYITVVEERQGQSVVVREKLSEAARIRLIELYADRAYGKAPQFAPIEDGDPLDLTEQAAAAVAAEFAAHIDELAERRAEREAQQQQAQAQ